ncbi:carbohydrate ABC transporter permease [Leadbettera azotonutricia]|uniref:Protein LplC n=1 Tax=Leadbettera azotonutricia (strain ATCC BAA-888 / DSM 13862 / ZAS-9) TaxID=545695 RepID=F5YEJ5_LEAAZ|nr:carbohydrate ABC transporter permease [Leadbettera azotonutricia]AEF82448.1 protein LplC [Leadbettera azotonutricia ZAS-9]
MGKRTIRKTREDYIINFVIYLFLGIIFFVTAYPFYLSIILSFNEGIDAANGGIYFFPRKFTLSNYQGFLTDEKWILAIGVTTVRTLLGTIVTTLFTCVVAYGLAQENLVGRKVYMTITILCLYFSGGLIPYYMVLRSLHLINSFLVYIVPSALNLFYALVAISFFQNLPKELHESAHIDGAGEIPIFFKIILPLSKPLLATIAIFTGVGHWNSWFDSAFFVQNKNLRTLGYLLMEVINRSNLNTRSQASIMAVTSNIVLTPMAVQVTAMVIAAFPIMIIYPFLQKYFITGLTVGSVKG